MPLPGCHSIFKGGKHDSGMPKVLDFSSAQPSSFVPEHDFIELLWENGHVVMQGPSNRFKKSSISSLGGKSKEKEAKDAGIPKSGRHYPVLNTADASECSFEPTGPSGQPILGSQDDDLVPWLNCPLDDYCAEFLPEFSGVSPNPLVPSDRTNAFGQAPRDSHAFENGSSSRPPAGSSEVNRMNNNCSSLHQLFQLPQQFCTLGSPSARPKEPDLMMGAMAEGSGGGDLAAPAKMLKQNIAPSRPMHPNNSNCSSGTTVMNFSHFTRPVALVKANLMGVDRGRGSDRIPTAACSIPVESMAVDSAGGLKTFSSPNGHLDLAPARADPNSVVQVSSEMPVTVQPETNSREEVANDSRNHKKADSPGHRKMVPDNTRSQGASFKAMGLRGAENQHGVSTIASSSVCSAIGGAGSAANDSRSRSKWKCSEGEESECPSEPIWCLAGS